MKNKDHKISVLVVHDNREMCDLFAQLLDNDAFDVYAAANSGQAMDIVEQKAVDLVFLDMHLPGADSLSVLTKVRQLRSAVKVIMMSGHDDGMIRSKALQLGAVDYLRKPFQMGAVLRTIEKAMQVTLVERKASSSEAEDTASLLDLTLSYKILDRERSSFVWMCVIGMVCLVLVVFGLTGYFYQRTDRTYDTPYANPTALTWDGNSLWVSDWVTQSYYQHDPLDKCTIRTVFYLQGSHPTGLTWDGTSLWSCNAWENKVYRHRMDESFAIVEEYVSPGTYPSGLYFDGTYLWICDSQESRLYKTRIDAKNGRLKLLDSYESPGKEPVGIFSDGINIWTADAQTGLIYKHAYDRQLTVQSMYRVQQYQTGRNRLSGMTWDGKHIWTCSEGSRKIYRHKIHNLKRITTDQS